MPISYRPFGRPGYGLQLPADVIQPGIWLDSRYFIHERIGIGGMSEVWRADDYELRSPVAVKLLPRIWAYDPQSVEELGQEARLLFRLVHPNICRWVDINTLGQIKFLVMEYIPGCTLSDFLQSRPGGYITIDHALPIAQQIAAALDYAHALSPSILHRDVKPSNVMIASNWSCKLLDFGIARQIKPATIHMMTVTDRTGTLPYMSPEQYCGAKPTIAMDVYSLAATIYECLAGHPPFHQGDIADQLLRLPPPPIDGISDQVNRALAAGLAKRPGDRPGSAGELVAMVAGSTPVRRSGAARVRRRRQILCVTLLLLMALAFLVLAGVMAFY